MSVWVGALGVLAAVLSAVAACDDADSYLYSAQKYDPVSMCLGAYAPVEAVSGAGAGAKCAPSCSTVGADLFVSTMCPPLPTVATAVDDSDPTCKAALDALARGGSCDSMPPSGDAEVDSAADAEPGVGADAGPDARDGAGDG